MAARGSNPSFAATRFTSRNDAAAQMVDRALAFTRGRADIRLLDLGCGSGAVAIEAARERPDWRVVALDISPVNIAAVRAAADASGVGKRVETICTDYLKWHGQFFDVIISDSTLHLIEGDDEALASRLAADLMPGGVLVATMPTHSVGNRLRIVLRRAWRAMPPGADRIALVLARALYRSIPPALLADRIPYLRVIPARAFGPRLTELFAQHGLEIVEMERLASPSIAKPSHVLIVWRRRA